MTKEKTKKIRSDNNNFPLSLQNYHTPFIIYYIGEKINPIPFGYYNLISYIYIKSLKI